MTDTSRHGSSGAEWLAQRTPPLSRLGLGTVAFGRSTGLKYAKPTQRPSDQQLQSLLTVARDLGINLLDTATAYGDGQARLGALTTNDPHWVIMTKVGERHRDGQSTYDFSATALRTDLRDAQRQLQRPVLDIVLLHSKGDAEAQLLTGAALGTLKDAQAAGQIRCIGASLKTTDGIEAAWDAGVDVLMLTLNEREAQLAPWIRESAARGICVVIKKPLASGALGIQSLGWVAAQPGVSSTIIGTVNPAHLRANAMAVTEAKEADTGTAAPEA